MSSKAARRMSAGRVQGGSRGGRTVRRADTRDYGFVLGGFSGARRASQLKWLDRHIPEPDRPGALAYLVTEDGSERAVALAAELAGHWGLELPEQDQETGDSHGAAGAAGPGHPGR